MAGSGKPTTGSDQSLGDLVALATKDLSQLVRHEIDLAKSELRADLKRAATGGALFGIAAFFGFGILVSLFFAYVYLLHWAGAWGGMAGAFAWTALTVAFLALVSGFTAWRLSKRFSGMKRTRETVTQDISLLRRKPKDGTVDGEVSGRKARKALRSATPGTQAHLPSPDGQRTAIADPTPPR